jgi:ankyrin repeat protein
MNVTRAAAMGDVQAVKKWLSDPPRTRPPAHAGSLLATAAYYGHNNICQLMLDSDQVDDGHAAMALTTACQSNQLSTAQLLVRRRHIDTHDLTRALSHACVFGHKRIAVWLMSDVIRLSQADRIAWLLTVQCARGDMSDIRQLAARVDTDVTRVMSQALTVACHNGRGDVVEWLTSHTTADVSSFGVINAAVDGKVTALMVACDMSEHGIVRRLLECVTPHTVNMVSGKVHDTALHFTIDSELDAHNPLQAACVKGDINRVTSSLCDSNVDIQMIKGYTALHFACVHGHVDIVRLLLCVFARTDITDDERQTPAMYAEQFRHTQVLPYLQPTLTGSPDIAVPVRDNNNSVSISVTSVDDATKFNNNKNNKNNKNNNSNNRPVTNGKRSSIKIV